MPEYLPAFGRPASASSAACAGVFPRLSGCSGPAVYELRSVRFRRYLAVGARTSEGRLSASIAVIALEPVTGPCEVEPDGKSPRAEASKVSAPKVRRVQRYPSGIFQPRPYSQ